MIFKRRRVKKGKIEVIPMIDLMIVLLIFYMSFSSLAEQELGGGVNIPIADQSKKWKKIPNEIIINMPNKANIIVGPTHYTRKTIIPMLTKLTNEKPKLSVVIRAEKKLKYEEVGKLLKSCVEGGVWNISFACMESSK